MQPRVDLYEVDGEFVIEVEIPGARPKDVCLEVDVDRVRISGCKSDSTIADELNASPTTHRRERALGRFVREIPLPMPVLRDAAIATLNHGLLTIRLVIRKADPPRWNLPIDRPARMGRPTLDCLPGGGGDTRSRR